MSETLPIGVIHLDVQHGQVEENRAALTAHAVEAARRGAKIIVAPELAVFGYSFEKRGRGSACAEVLRGPTFESLSGVAGHHGVLIAAGIAACRSSPTLLVLPRGVGAFSGEELAHLVEGRPLAIVADLLSGPNRELPAYGLFSSTQCAGLVSGESSAVVDFGPARIALVRGNPWSTRKWRCASPSRGATCWSPAPTGSDPTSGSCWE